MAITLAGCSTPPRDFYDFDFQKPVPYDQLIYRSQHIVVGVVKRVRMVREGVPAVRDPDLLLDEMAAELDVENVLHGDLEPGRLRSEYFTLSMKNPGGYSGPPWIRLEPGERRIFFLTRESGIYRSVADVRGDYTILMRSGRHERIDTSRGPGFAIAEAVLRLGSDHDTQGTFYWNVPVLTAISSRTFVLGLLEGLVRSPTPAIAAAACRELAQFYPGRCGCLALHSYKEDEAARCRAGDLRLIEELRRTPFYGSAHYARAGNIADLRDELRLMLEAENPEVAQAACEAMIALRIHKPGRCGVK